MDPISFYYGYLFFFIILIVLDKLIRDRRRRRQSTTTTTTTVDVESQNPPPIVHHINLPLSDSQIRLYYPPPAPAPILESEIKKIEEACTECVICLGVYKDDECGVGYRTLASCGHRFHEVCVRQWLEKEGHRSCPTCRRLVDRR